MEERNTMKFTCTYIQNETLLRQYYYNVKMKGVRKWLWLGLLLVAGSVALYIHSREPIDLVFLVLGVSYGIKELSAPYRAAKKELEKLTEKYGQDLPQTTVAVDAQKAVSSIGADETALPLEDVLGLYFCKDCIVLKGYSEDIILATEGLENAEETKEFLKKYCKNAPVYKR